MNTKHLRLKGLLTSIYPLSLAVICSSMLIYSLTSRADYQIDSMVFNNKSLPFTSHKGPGAFDTYLTQEVQFDPVADVFEQVVSEEGLELKNRGEAHITVITPVEFDQVLKKHVTIEEIDAIAIQENIQSAEFKIVCLGAGSIKAGGKTDGAFVTDEAFSSEKTFFIVIQSEDLLRIRQKIQELYISRGGSKEDFDFAKFYSHITVGFTSRDLHESDGVIKDARSCRAPLSVR